jgi:hypothetical protein
VSAGSSGGTAAAVAASLGAVGLGTDTGNSIRGPSSHQALVGIRSTMGLTSRAGVVPLNLAFDIAGPMARTVADAVAVFQVVAGFDPDDPATAPSRNRAIPTYAASLVADGLRGARIGVLRQAYDRPSADPEVLEVFARALDDLRSAGIEPGLVHVAGSGGILARAGAFADAVRPGLALYGMLPTWATELDPGLRPVLALKARALRIFELGAGEPIGYGLRWRAERPTRIATLGIGYGDGWPRAHANNGWVLVHGRRVPLVGAVSMDGITVNLGDIDGVTYDDEFVLIGEQGGARITTDEVAAERRTINYEVTTALRGRLPRLHIGAG